VCESNAPATGNLPPAGFEDREDHRTPCASVVSTAYGSMLAGVLVCCLGLAESRCVKVVHVEHCTGKFAHTVMYVYYR